MPKLKLKPCPFCGGEAEVLDLSYPINMPPWEVKGYGVVCPCGASVRMFDKKTEAAEAWNRRLNNEDNRGGRAGVNIQDLFEPLWNISDQTPKKNTGKEGKWINVGHKMGIFSHPYSVNYKCPYCDYEAYWVTPDFCPECGAHLLDEDEEMLKEMLGKNLGR